MIQYKRCSDVNIDLVYEAFKVDFQITLLKWKFQKGILYNVFGTRR